MPKGPKKPKKNLQRRAIDDPRITLEDLAKAVGRTRGALEKYREEKRAMPESVKKRLAAFLDKHAHRLSEIAKELRRSK